MYERDVIQNLKDRIATLTAERDALQAEVSRLTDVVRHAEYWEAKRKEERDAAVKERDALRDDLRACAEAAKFISDLFYGKVGIAYGSEIRRLRDALNRPGVQAVMAQKGGDADGKEEVR